ncbi:MAG: tetratricopeptide repeat protein [Bacteroidales bacterium]|nr:tetratricopeptide repeat protein [Bacteroidales bacterium]
MKKLFALITVLISFTFVNAQKIEVQNASNYLRNGQLEKAKIAIDKATMNPESNKEAKTWFLAGNIDLEINSIYIKEAVLKLGMNIDSAQAALAIFGPPSFPEKPISNKKAKLENGKKGRKLEYKDKLILIFDENNNLISFSEPTDGKYKNIKPDLLSSAIEAYGKALPLAEAEGDNQLQQNIKINLGVSTEQIFNLGVKCFNLSDYMGAAENFARAAEVSKNYLGNVDEKAVVNENIAVLRAIDQLIEQNDTIKAIEYIEIRKQITPDNLDLITREANIYLSSGNVEKALQSLLIAESIDQSNPTIYFAIGTNYDQLEDYENAIAAYNKAIELKPDYSDAIYNLGAIYFNQGVAIIKEANLLPLNEEEKYNSMVTEATTYYEKALPYLEEAYKLNPSDKNTLETLKEIYTRTKKYEKLKEINEAINK